jgi:hypothetical protein
VREESYHSKLTSKAFPSILNEKGEHLEWFQQDATPAHYTLQYENGWINSFLNNGLEGSGPVECHHDPLTLHLYTFTCGII